VNHTAETNLYADRDITERLRELSKARWDRDAWERETTVRIPAEPDRDIDLVLASAAELIDRLRARVAEFERNAGRNPPFVAEWHARAVALGYDGVSDMLNSVERGEPPIHVAEVLARAASTKDGA